MNNAGSYDRNREIFCLNYDRKIEDLSVYTRSGERLDLVKENTGLKFLRFAQYNGQKLGSDQSIVVKFDNYYFSVTDGMWLTPSGIEDVLFEWNSSKSNNRRYKKITFGDVEIMVPDYWLTLAISVKLGLKPQSDLDNWLYGLEVYRRLTSYKEAIEVMPNITKAEVKSGCFGKVYETAEINHKNGDTWDSRPENLEVTTTGLNKAHSRLLSEINKYFPDIVEITGKDCQGNISHRFVNPENRISCEDILKYNNRESLKWEKFYSKRGNNPDKYEAVIAAYVDKKGVFRPRYSLGQIKEMLRFFKIKEV